MIHTFTNPDLIELDRTWPIGQMLAVPEHGNIVVAGAYRGRYIHYLSEMFPTADIFGYEPQADEFEALKQRFSNNGRIWLQRVGLATSTRIADMGLTGSDGASVLEISGTNYGVQLIDIVEAFHTKPGAIDLFLLNAEGSEWALIPYLLDEMMHHRIASIALQQHAKYASKERIMRVKSYLAEYYDLVYTDGQLDGWEFWRRK